MIIKKKPRKRNSPRNRMAAIRLTEQTLDALYKEARILDLSTAQIIERVLRAYFISKYSNKKKSK